MLCVLLARPEEAGDNTSRLPGSLGHDKTNNTVKTNLLRGDNQASNSQQPCQFLLSGEVRYMSNVWWGIMKFI